MGGGISAAFTSYFPTLVDSLILIAPSGLLRASHIHWTSRLIYGGLVPKTLVNHLVRRRLGGGSSATPMKSSNPEATPAKAVTGEVPDSEHPALSPDSHAPLFANRPSVSVADAVSWQLTHHQGFLPAFISSIQHAPISGQHDRWRLIGQRMAEQRTHPLDSDLARHGLQGGRALLVLGKDDTIVVANEIAEDTRTVLGLDGVEVAVLEGGHDLPIVHSTKVAQTIMDFWHSTDDR